MPKSIGGLQLEPVHQANVLKLYKCSQNWHFLRSLSALRFSALCSSCRPFTNSIFYLGSKGHGRIKCNKSPVSFQTLLRREAIASEAFLPMWRYDSVFCLYSKSNITYILIDRTLWYCRKLAKPNSSASLCRKLLNQTNLENSGIKKYRKISKGLHFSSTENS